jgi:hypothetical protein
MLFWVCLIHDKDVVHSKTTVKIAWKIMEQVGRGAHMEETINIYNIWNEGL